MSAVLRKLFFLRNILFRPRPKRDEIAQEKWVADFGKTKSAHFDIKSESSYDAKLQKFGPKHCLTLGLKKTGCIAWVEAPNHRYGDLVIHGRIRLDVRGGYGAAGVMFRMADQGTYYLLLISSKGYFRLDVVRNGTPFPLIGWTELPAAQAADISAEDAVGFSAAAYGGHILIALRDKWAGEVDDSSIAEGTLCFAAASYEEPDPSHVVARAADGVSSLYTAEAFLESLTVESRIAEVSAFYEKWSGGPGADPLCRFHLAETFAAMDRPGAALAQIRKAWESPGHKKSQRELLLAGRLARELGLAEEAESCISACFQEDLDTPEGKEALTEMAQILYLRERFKELKDYCAEAVKLKPADPLLRAFRGHACWNLGEYRKAAAAYDEAFGLDKTNGLLAKNAANTYEVLGKKKEALKRYLEAGRVFLSSGNYNDLGLLVPKLLSLGAEDWEARALVGKWAFGIEDFELASGEFVKAEELKKKHRPRAAKDPALVYLQALLLIRKGKRGEALPLLKEAADLEKGYPLFRFKLAENRFLLDDDPNDPRLAGDLEKALELAPDDGWINNLAAQVSLRKEDLESAARYLDKAVEVLGEVLAIRVNRGVLLYLQGSLEEALKVLDADKAEDPEGVLANCAGNLLFRAGRFDEADNAYRKALAAAPDTIEYLANRASCLVEMAYYGEADTVLAKVHAAAPSPWVLNLISYVASKKGEYRRAEAASRAALEMDPCHVPSLLSLGWTLSGLGRLEEAMDCLRRLERLDLPEKAVLRREELKERLDSLLYASISCASCGRDWKVLKEPPPAPGLRLYATPPDAMPAGSCQACGKTWCIGCAKNHLDPSGRFLCPLCGRPLKLVNEGLKKIICDWAAADGLGNKNHKGRRKRGE
ncbi:MAG: tetratricopeptide repeat protein [Treponema sp.]|jgi:tetratricopeptide (TPR) repeat protein|nr:tetratricopeptide repeat protein [Treponema sp.]